MQFKLSTLMLGTVAVAIGCMGWKFGDWMIDQDNSILPVVYGLLGLTVLLWIALLFVGGRRAAICSALGFFGGVAILLASLGPPPHYVIESIAVVSAIASPGAFFAGSLAFVLDAKHPIGTRLTLFYPSCLLLSWLVSCFYHGA